jgi:hypothetical protein
MVCPSDLRALDAPSAEARAAADNLRLDFVNESADRAAKYASAPPPPLGDAIG